MASIRRLETLTCDEKGCEDPATGQVLDHHHKHVGEYCSTHGAEMHRNISRYEAKNMALV